MVEPRGEEMRRVISTFASAVGLAALVAATAAANGGPIVPGQTLGRGVAGPAGTPAGELRISTAQNPRPSTAVGRSTTVIATRTDGGEVLRTRRVSGTWGVPAVTVGGGPGGLSANGETVLLVRPSTSLRPDESRFLVMDAERLRVRDRLRFDGLVSFDAISPDGRLAYMVSYARNDPLEYDVRAYDVDAGRFRPGEIVDPRDPDEQMAGYPIAREMSPDGRWAYTLYTGGEEVFVHALDTVGETAACVDLHQFEPTDPFGSRLGLDVDPATGELTVDERGEAAATIDPESFEVTPVSEGAAEVAAGDDGTLSILAVIGGVALLAVAVGIAYGRRRREEARLGKVFAAAGTDEAEPADAERKRVPVP
jgi:hypothetical protein